MMVSGNGHKANGSNGKPRKEQGEGGSTVVGALDLSDGRDRQILRKNRWAITDDQKAAYVAALDVALDIALEKQDARALQSIVQTAAVLEGQNQRDEHLAIALAAKAAGLQDVKIEVVYEEKGQLPDGIDD